MKTQFLSLLLVPILFTGCAFKYPSPKVENPSVPTNVINLKIGWEKAGRQLGKRAALVAERDPRTMQQLGNWFGDTEEDTVAQVENNLAVMHRAMVQGGFTVRFFHIEDLSPRLQERFRGRQVAAYIVKGTNTINISKAYPHFTDTAIKVLHEVSHIAIHTVDHGYWRRERYVFRGDTVVLTGSQLLENADTYAYFIRGVRR